MLLYSASFVLAILVSQTLAGCNPSKSKPCPPGSDIPLAPVPVPAPAPAPRPNEKWLDKCPKGMPKAWACLDPKIKFPTVDCIVADIKTCGTLDANPVLLYSFGAATVNVRTKVRDVLNPRPAMWNNVLPNDWHVKMAKTERFALVQGKLPDPGADKRAEAFRNRFSAALTQAAKGEVILVTLDRNSQHGGSGAYSIPPPESTEPNVWRLYEFPMAQRNKDVTRVVSYALSDPELKRVVDFERGQKTGLLPMPQFPDPPLPKMDASPSPSTPRPIPSKPAAGPSTPTPDPGKPTPSPSKPTPSPSKPAPSPSKPTSSPSKPASSSTPALGPSKPKTSKKPSKRTYMKIRAEGRQEAANARKRSLLY
ncbi:hypothetical protein CC80DRAFT_494907 [Byssothecium circinans]|uniref:Uncharacterized protein n=1 Tax=Byssothecium circinans TaxID=147558 RepID=A0A6A5TKT9_9PLEO|nr:hypothetical protein CC80DRAFT_494907 [Byssothecium circinans]